MSEFIILNLFFFSVYATIHAFLGSLQFKRYLASKFGDIFAKAFYRIVYIMLSIIAFYPIILSFNLIPEDVIFYDFSGTMTYLILDTVRFFAAFLILDALFLYDYAWEFWGLKQIWIYFKEKNVKGLTLQGIKGTFAPTGLYNYTRHPIYMSVILFFICNPVMNLRNLMFLITFSIYFIISSYLEETRLITLYGDDYRHYQKLVPRYWVTWKNYRKRLEKLKN